MTPEPANETELNAAAWECADSSVALYASQQAHRIATSRYLDAAVLEDVDAAEQRRLREVFRETNEKRAAAVLRHRAATAQWARIKPPVKP